MKILVRSPNWIGDQILAYPFFHYLREAYPDARIGAACVPWVEELQFRNLVDEVISLPRHRGSGLLDRWESITQAAGAIRERGGWDLGILLTNSLSSALIFQRAGIARRRGFDTDFRGFLLNEKVHWPQNTVEHRAQAYLSLLPKTPARPASEFFGLPPEDEFDDPSPGVIPAFEPKKAWPTIQPIEPPADPYYVIAPGSAADSRRWPLERFAELAHLIVERTGWRGAVVGGLSEVAAAEKLCSDRSLKLINLVAQGPVPSLWRVFARARFAVSNDSGLAHLATLLRCPIQIAWGAGNPKRTMPMGGGRIQVSCNPIDCWPCEKNICALPPGRRYECLAGISAESVFEALFTERKKEARDGLRP